jgi:hypothetical protein
MHEERQLFYERLSPYVRCACSQRRLPLGIPDADACGDIDQRSKVSGLSTQRECERNGASSLAEQGSQTGRGVAQSAPGFGGLTGCKQRDSSSAGHLSVSLKPTGGFGLHEKPSRCS